MLHTSNQVGSIMESVKEDKKISIIMGVYNAEKTLNSAIESIIDQSYTDWELIICDDASTDSSLKIINEYESQLEKKIKIISNKKNLGLALSLNKCLKLSTGFYIARMDADDISHKERLQIQLEYIVKQKIDLVGTSMVKINSQKNKNEVIIAKAFPGIEDYIYSVPFFHATILAKKSVFDTLNGYNSTPITSKYGQDLDLWFRFFNHKFIGHNIPEPLYYYNFKNKINSLKFEFKYQLDMLKIRSQGFKIIDLNIFFRLFLNTRNFALIFLHLTKRIVWKK